MDQESSSTSEKTSQNPIFVVDNSKSLSDSESVIQIRENQVADSVFEEKGSTVEEEKSTSFVIDVKENQRVCRICHLNAKEIGDSSTSVELKEIGCGCKGELGVAHLDCAEAWFRVKGNRVCEICGQTANNITGVRDNGFLEEWNEAGPATNTHPNYSSDGPRRCLGRHPFCNFLMACLVVAFIIPWFLRISIF